MNANVQSIRTLVVDDEPLARNDLLKMLSACAQINIVGQCGSGKEALTAIRELIPDVVFLDVQMPECDGFEVLERLGARLPPVVVFVTAYDTYALRAFEAGALDYLLKPFDDARFQRMLSRVIERFGAIRTAPPSSDRIIIKSPGEVIFQRISDIDWIESADYYTCLHVGAVTHTLRRSLSELEADLRSAGFARIHRSTVVNLARVTRLAVNSEGEHVVELSDGTLLGLSRRYRRLILERLRGDVSAAMPAGRSSLNPK
jgi:two-component system, LytTR family, response regulator